MYLFFGILLTAGALFSVIFFYRRKQIICKIRSMCRCRQICELNRLTQPFGFYYFPSQDIMRSLPDAWQREFGYHALFDRTAPHFQIVVDCEPVYFDYDGRTWLIEFWKGQYGINLGGEIGIYRADRIVSPQEYDKTLFRSVPDEYMLPLSMKLSYRGKQVFHIEQNHWWLTGFCMGLFGYPKDVKMEASVAFLDKNMQQSFIQAMFKVGYTAQELEICDCSVKFCFANPRSVQPRKVWYCSAAFSQWKNRLFCRLFNRMTGMFECTSEKLLFLYYLIPLSFRHTLSFRKNRYQKNRGKYK